MYGYIIEWPYMGLFDYTLSPKTKFYYYDHYDHFNSDATTYLDIQDLRNYQNLYIF